MVATARSGRRAVITPAVVDKTLRGADPVCVRLGVQTVIRIKYSQGMPVTRHKCTAMLVLRDWRYRYRYKRADDF